MAEEFLEWIKLPQDLQHKFFELAGQEAARLTETIQRLNLGLKELKDRLQSYIHRLPTSSEISTVAAVDGSRSPRLNERLGVRYGVFTSGAVILKGFEEREQTFGAGVFKRNQAFSADKSKYFFDLLATHTERKMALEVLDRCDLLILDGSFYGFIYYVLRMKKSGMLGESEERILRETVEATETLKKSGKVIGVIKRSRTRAIGGYLTLKGDLDNLFTTTLDKLILTILMPEKSYFSYEELLGEGLVQVYTRIARVAARLTPESQTREDLMAEAEKEILIPFDVLGLGRDLLKGLKRLQVKFSKELPPCEVEYPSTIGEAELLKVLGQRSFFNEATNLPIALDLVDSMVGLPSKFTEEFVSEVEGRVLEAAVKNRQSQETVKTFFTLLNPQKQY